MEAYLLLKTAHIISATVLFGTGIGIAFFFWRGTRSGHPHAAYFAARTTVLADIVFTAAAVVVQPLTGLLLVLQGGFDPFDRWLATSYVLYLVAGACWVPVLVLQKRIRDQLAVKLAGGEFDQSLFDRRRRQWFWLGWPAFLALVVVFHLMVSKPA